MRLDALVAPGQFRKSAFYTLGAIAVFFYLAYELAQYVLAGDLMGLAFLGLFLVILAFVVVILNDWRRGYYFFLGWLMFEDLFRKYLGNNMVIHFAKDVILAVVSLSFFLWRGRKQVQLFHPPFRLALLIFAWFALWFSLGILFRLPSLSVNPAPSGFVVRDSPIPRTA
jgi:hypothetical protein